MFKRLFWLVIGAAFGFGVAFYLMRMVRSTVEKISPDNVGNQLAGAIKDLGSNIRAAVAEGREAMQERETQIREELTRR